MSLAVATRYYGFEGESANFLSIAAIDFGIIADIPLLFVENYLRNLREYGAGRRSLAQSTQEVGWLLLLSIILVGISFIPVFLMEGAEKRIFAPMVKTYLYAIGASIIITFSFLVAVLVLFVKSTGGETLLVRFWKEYTKIYLTGW